MMVLVTAWINNDLPFSSCDIYHLEVSDQSWNDLHKFQKLCIISCPVLIILNTKQEMAWVEGTMTIYILPHPTLSMKSSTWYQWSNIFLEPLCKSIVYHQISYHYQYWLLHIFWMKHYRFHQCPVQFSSNWHALKRSSNNLKVLP